MKNRIFAILMCLVLMMGILPATAVAAEIVDSGKCGDNLTWTLDGDETLTISGEGEMWDYSDDEENNTPWALYAWKIEQIVIEDGVERIGKAAFRDCIRVIDIEIPESVTEIGASVFSRCLSLTEIEFPNGINKINEFTFEFCDSLTEIHLPDSIVEIGDGAFMFCSSLTELNIPDGVVGVGRQIVFLCEDLTKITVPASVKSLSESAFYACPSQTEIYFEGDAPKFEGEDLLFTDGASVYYPEDNPTWKKAKREYPNADEVLWNGRDGELERSITKLIFSAVAGVVTCAAVGIYLLRRKRKAADTENSDN